MTHDTALDTPWSIRFERDGTEDIAIIDDANGHELVTSRPFWLPEGDDPIPTTLAALHLMAISPRLLAAAKNVFTALELILEVDGPEALSKADLKIDPLESLRAVIIEAESVGGIL